MYGLRLVVFLVLRPSVGFSSMVHCLLGVLHCGSRRVSFRILLNSWSPALLTRSWR